jgi:UDP-N-acetylmuramoyl-tripeptide--D-alanyl-D-alanine ligase
LKIENFPMVLFIIFILLWFSVIVQRTLRWVWLWQIKEYRLDRFFAEFSGIKLVRLLFSGWQRFKAIFFLGAVAGAAVFFGEGFLLWGALLIYAAEAGYSGWKARRAGIQTPVFTAKAIFLTVWTLGVEAGALIILPEARGLAKGAVFAVSFPLLLDLFLPFGVFAGLLMVKIPTAVMRYMLMRRARRRLAGLPNLLIIAVTGSFGKSSTKEFLATLLSKRYRVAKAPEHVNSEIALAKFITTGLNETHEILIAELGAYRGGEIRRMARMLQPSIGILTGINEQHIALFGSLENIKRAKYELIEALPERGLAVFNGGTPGSRELFESSDRPKKLYSVDEPADCYAEDVRLELGELVFQVKSAGESRTFKVPLLGFQHVPNILAAATVALSLGMTLEEIRERAQYLDTPSRTMQRVFDARGRIVIDDTYSANPDGVYAALEALRSMEASKKVLVMPSLIELGKASDRIHEEIGRKAAGICDLIILTTHDAFRALERGIGSVEKLAWAANASTVLTILNRETGAGDAILLESRVPEGVRKALLESGSRN